VLGIDSQGEVNCAGIGWYYPINKLISNALNGKTNEVASREDLVFALRNNILKANEVALA